MIFKDSPRHTYLKSLIRCNQTDSDVLRLKATKKLKSVKPTFDHPCVEKSLLFASC